MSYSIKIGDREAGEEVSFDELLESCHVIISICSRNVALFERLEVDCH